MSAKEVDGAEDAKKVSDESKAPAKGKEEIIDLEEPIGDDGVNYDVYADDIEDKGVKKKVDDEIDFTSDRLRRRKEEKYFVRVEGDEKRKKIAEREQKAKEKRTLREMRHESKQKNVSGANRLNNERDASEKSAEAELRRQRWGDFREKLYIIFIEGWHKFATIVASLVLIAGAVWLVIAISQSNNGSKNEDIPVVDAQDFRNEIGDILSEDGDYEKACVRAEELITEARKNGDSRLMDMLVSFAEFIIDNRPSEDSESMEKAHQSLMSASYEVESNTQCKRLYEVYVKYDEKVGDVDNLEFHKTILQGLEDGSINYSNGDDDESDSNESYNEDEGYYGDDDSDNDASSNGDEEYSGDDGYVDDDGETYTEDDQGIDTTE
jgi:hypothetical protein